MTKSKPTATPAKASKSGNSPSMSANAAPRSSPRLQPQAAPAAKQQPQQQKKKAQKPESSENEEEEEEEDDDDDEELNVDAEVDELEDDEDEDEEMDEEDDEEEEEEAPKPKSSKSAAVAPATTSKKSPSLSSTPAPAKKSPALTSTPAPAAAAADKKSKKRKAEEDEEDEEEQQAPPSKKIAAEAPVASSSSASSSSQIAIPKFNNPATFSFEPNAAAFSSLPLSEATMKAIKDMGFTNMTPVQAKCIPVALKGEDILGAAKTGSGKTLAFLIPAVELLVRSGFKPRNGTGVLVISPTRELALQIYGVTRELCKYHIFTHTMVMGGANMKPEQEKLTSGVNLLVGTPGRILDHLEHCSTWNYKSLVSLIIDEADRILEMGFEDQLRAIIKRLPPTPRQTLLFSATQTKNVKDIAILSMSGTPIYIGVDDSNQTSTAEGVEQGYVVCPSENRFLLLFTFLKRNLNKKVIVFFSTCAATQFYTELLNYIDIPVVELHGKQKQNKRTTTFFEFCNAQKGIMLCTDVAARGLDIPSVDWIIQFDPPEEPKEYIHRVGRTARGGGKKGRALLFLLPQELGFLKYLKEAKIPLNEYEFPSNKIARVQNQLEKVVSENYYLHKSAREAYRSYMQGYAQHTLKSCFNVAALDVLAVSKSFGFDAPPKVHLKISLKALKNTEKRQNQQQQGDFPSKHGFSEDNPYGKKQMSASEREDRDNDERARRAQAEVTKKPQQSRQWSR